MNIIKNLRTVRIITMYKIITIENFNVIILYANNSRNYLKRYGWFIIQYQTKNIFQFSHPTDIFYT